MTRTFVHWLIGFLVTLVVSGGLYWLVGNVGLAAVTGLTWGSGLLIALRIARQRPAHTTGDSLKDKRWTVVSTGLMTLAALVGVSPTLPIETDIRLALGLLIIGVSFVGYTAGTMAELERNAK